MVVSSSFIFTLLGSILIQVSYGAKEEESQKFEILDEGKYAKITFINKYYDENGCWALPTCFREPTLKNEKGEQTILSHYVFGLQKSLDSSTIADSESKITSRRLLAYAQRQSERDQRLNQQANINQEDALLKKLEQQQEARKKKQQEERKQKEEQIRKNVAAARKAAAEKEAQKPQQQQSTSIPIVVENIECKKKIEQLKDQYDGCANQVKQLKDKIDQLEQIQQKQAIAPETTSTTDKENIPEQKVQVVEQNVKESGIEKPIMEPEAVTSLHSETPWNKCKLFIYTKSLWKKYQNNVESKQILLNTKDAKIVACAPKSSGISQDGIIDSKDTSGLICQNTDVLNQIRKDNNDKLYFEKGTGDYTNVLGKALMVTRGLLYMTETDEFKNLKQCTTTLERLSEFDASKANSDEAKDGITQAQQILEEIKYEKQCGSALAQFVDYAENLELNSFEYHGDSSGWWNAIKAWWSGKNEC